MPSLDEWPGGERRHPRLSTPQWAVRAPLAAWLEQQARDAGEGYRVLDVGCGPKPYYPFFAERASEYVGVDVVPHAAAELVGRISRPVYGVGEQSGIKLRKVVPRISWLLLKGFFWRLREKYVIRDFHPLVFFYALGILMTLVGLVLGVIEVILRLMGNEITTPTIVLVVLLLISGIQFTLFAMWFDMEPNKDLR